MEFKRKTLSNGIKVLMEKRESPVVAFSISNPYGGAYEDSEDKGVAHFIEHLMFTGTKTRSNEDISREIEKKGGILNAFTAHQVTSYWFKMPKEHLISGMDIIVDMLKNPAFLEEKFEKEKKVILEEIKMYNDNPRKKAMEDIEKAMFEAPFGELIIGSKETVSGLSREKVMELFKENYNPSNFVVTVVGDADFDEVCEYMEKAFEAGEGKPKMREIKKKSGHMKEERPGIDQANFIFAMHAPLQTEERHATLDVLNAYLAKGMSSRLFLEIREKRGLAYTVSGSVDAEKDYSVYQIYVGTTKEKVDEVKDVILDEFHKVDEMNEENLKEAKEMLVGLRKVSAEESVNVMNELMFAEMAERAENYYEFEDKIKNVKLDDVKALAKELVSEYSTALVTPK